MSTYLVAFVVGEFEYVEVFSNGTRVRVYTPIGEVEKGKFALSVGTRTLSFLSEYFDEKYPLPKLDMIAIPDFSAGAMENWQGFPSSIRKERKKKKKKKEKRKRKRNENLKI